MERLTSPLIASLPGVSAMFFGRGEPPRPDPALLALRLAPRSTTIARTVTARQVHSATCLIVERTDGPDGVLGEGDAILTSRPGVALGIATADCLPIVLVDPEAPALGVVHAGWRGTRAGVLGAAVERMSSRLAARPHRIRMAIGPCARACCYEVGPEVAEAFEEDREDAASACVVRGPHGIRLDLVAANFAQARRAGIAPGSCDVVGTCSICRPDLCHSYRRDGAAAGRMWLLATLI